MRKLVVLTLTIALLLSMTVSAFAAERGWVIEGNNWVYLDNNGDKVTDTFKSSGSSKYYLDNDGNMATNKLIEHNSKYYYASEDGALLTNGWAFVTSEDDSEDHWMYFTNDGSACTNTGDSVKLRDINGKKYGFDSEGKMLHDWVSESGEIIESGSDDEPLQAMYCFGDESDGVARTGWVKYVGTLSGSDKYDDKEEFWFYFNPSNGKKIVNQEKTINGHKYSFDENGVMITEWVEVPLDSPSSAYDYRYFKEDGSKPKKAWVYAVPDENMGPGCAEDHADDTKRWFYTDGSGNIIKNTTKKINNKYYAFDDEGRMQAEFVELTGTSVGGSEFISQHAAEDVDTEFFREVAASGKNIYYFSGSEESDGSMKTGNIKIELSDETRQFYFNSNGCGANGIKNNKLYAAGMLLAADEDRYTVQLNYADGKYYVVNTSGVVLNSGKTAKDDSSRYYAVYQNTIVLIDDGENASKAASQFAKDGTYGSYTVREIQRWN